MSWLPDSFSAQMIARLEEEHGHGLVSVPFFDGLLSGELDGLVESFAGKPELHDPLRGRIKGKRALQGYVADMRAWLSQHHASTEEVARVLGEGRDVEEVVLHLEVETGPVGLPVAIVADRRPDGRIDELRIYHSSWPVKGHHLNRPPLLQPDPELRPPDIVVAFGSALAAGDLDSILATFEEDGSLREPAGDPYLYTGPDGLRAFYQPLLSRGGIPLELCTMICDDRVCALEYNVVGWGPMVMPPQAAMGVFVQGASGRLAALRLYDDVDRPLPPESESMPPQ